MSADAKKPPAPPAPPARPARPIGAPPPLAPPPPAGIKAPGAPPPPARKVAPPPPPAAALPPPPPPATGSVPPPAPPSSAPPAAIPAPAPDEPVEDVVVPAAAAVPAEASSIPAFAASSPAAAPVPAVPAHSSDAGADAPVDRISDPFAARDARGGRSTMEFLFELDAPTGPTSREIDLRDMPEVSSALEADEPGRTSLPDFASTSDPPPTDARATGEFGEPEPAPISERPGGEPPPGPISEDGSPVVPTLPAQLPRIVLKSQAAARTAEEQHEQRKRRVIGRVATCRDAFRVLGFLDIRDTDRKDVARTLMGLDEALDPGAKAVSVAKDPANALANASKEAFDRMERLISPIEDKLLALDELVASETFAARVAGGKITAKALARYGRLLASRRMQAGQRRDRFEWIATHLLTRKRAGGPRELVDADRAAAVLELLIGGLPYKVKDQELEEALAYLGDALQRLPTFRDQEAFFDSEYFLDVHGYKVSMREQLLCPDFVYVSVAINAQLENMIEVWVHKVERLHNANQLSQEGSPREQVQRRLREEEEAVGKIFGAKPRAIVQVAALAQARRKEPELKKKAKPKKKRKKSFSFEFDARVIKLILTLLAIGGAGTYLAFETGSVAIERKEDIPPAKLKAVSPLIVRAEVHGSGKNRELEGLMKRPTWRDMKPEARRAAADQIAKGLSELGIQKARITAGKTKVIEIQQGLVAFVQADGAP